MVVVGGNKKGQLEAATGRYRTEQNPINKGKKQKPRKSEVSAKEMVGAERLGEFVRGQWIMHFGGGVGVLF